MAEAPKGRIGMTQVEENACWRERVRHENAKAIDLSKRQIEDGTESRSDESQGLRKVSKSQTGPEAGGEDQDLRVED